MAYTSVIDRDSCVQYYSLVAHAHELSNLEARPPPYRLSPDSDSFCGRLATRKPMALKLPKSDVT